MRIAVPRNLTKAGGFVAAAAMFGGLILSSVGQARASDATATAAYLRDDRVWMDALKANIPAGLIIANAYVTKTSGECPKVVVNPPPESHTQLQLVSIAIDAVALAMAKPDLQAARLFGREVEHLHWTTRNLGVVHKLIPAGLAESIRLVAEPNLCAILKQWVAGGYKALPREATSFMRMEKSRSRSKLRDENECFIQNDCVLRLLAVHASSRVKRQIRSLEHLEEKALLAFLDALVQPVVRLEEALNLRPQKVPALARAPVASGGRAERVPIHAHGFALAGCRAGAPIPSVAYDLGSSFDGLPRRSLKTEDCNPAAPRGVPVISGPTEAVGFVSVIYGSCDASEGGCAPPLDVQSWPECARNPNSYKPSPGAPVEPEAPANPPRKGVRLSAAPWIPAASSNGGTTIELYTGKTTIVVFANDERTATDAANALARAAAAEAPLAAARLLRAEANQPGDASACHHLLARAARNSAPPAGHHPRLARRRTAQVAQRRPW